MIRRLAFRVFHSLRAGDDVLEQWGAAEQAQWSDPAIQRASQRQRLAALVAHGRAHVPHYHGMLEMVGDEELEEALAGDAWHSVPVLDKSIIREAADGMLSTATGTVALPNATSGSTGESLRFYLDAASRGARAARTHRFHRWASIDPWDRHAKLWGARFDAPSPGLRQKMTAYLHPQLFLSSYGMSGEQVRQYASQLMDFRPRALTSYPSPLEYFASNWSELGGGLPELRAIICSAEQLHDHQRKLFEATFGCPVFDRYGSREFGNIAQECEQHDGLHVAADHLMVELLDEQGVPVPDGSVGEIVITDLDNRAMPFIRYRTGDLARWAEGVCGCGRTLPRLEAIQGRVMDLIHAPGGAVISGTFWPQIVKQASLRVRVFQVVQDTPDAILIRLVMDPAGGLSTDERNSLLGRIGERSPELRVDLEYVDDIPLTSGGKRRTVVSRLADGDAT